MGRLTGSNALVRRAHIERVLRVLQHDGPASRADIALRTGISRTTVSEITGVLLASKAITVVETDASRRSGSGRPAELLATDPAAGQYLGIDFGHRRVHVSIADASHAIIASGEAAYAEETRWPDRLGALFTLIDDVLQHSGVHLESLNAVGAGIPGPLTTTTTRERDDDTGRRPERQWLESELFARFGATVRLDTNTRYAALCEAQHANGDQTRDAIYLRIGDGIGGGIVVGGRLVSGAKGLAAEFGHIRSVDGGPPCRCGKNGCLETVAALPALLAACAARGFAAESVDEFRAANAAGHPVVDDVVSIAGVAVGRVLAAAALILNPAIVIVGGEVPRHAPGILRVIADTLRDELSSTAPAVPLVLPAAFSGDEGSRGAIAALFQSSALLAQYPERDTHARPTAS